MHRPSFASSNRPEVGTPAYLKIENPPYCS
jgi:hypothetical protein